VAPTVTTIGEIAAQRARLAGPPLGVDVDLARCGPYRAFPDVLGAVEDLARGGARPLRLGATVSGEPLFALEVGPPDAPRASVLLGGMHAMEWIGVETGLAIFARLVDAPPVDRRVLYVPVVNVDGYRVAEANLRAGRRRFHRSNGHGVDLNRNWGTHWKGVKWEAKLLPFLGGPGTAPRSEPEVDAICTALDAVKDGGVEIERAISLHSFGRMLLVPFGGAWRRPDTHAAHVDAARAVQSRLDGAGYRIRQSARWVPGQFAHGMELDDLCVRYRATSLLVECSPGGARLADPSTWLHPWRWFNPPDPSRTIERLVPALEPFLRGA
jgi:hypothetical protein